MRKHLCFFIVTLVVTLILSASAWAAKRALVIGINTYRYHDQLMEERRIPLNLEGCTDDAKDMRQALIDFLDFSPSEIKMLLNEQASLAAIEHEIAAWLVNETRPGDSVFFYFSGHGFLMQHPRGDQTLLCPHDANPFDLSNLLSANRMAELFSGLKGRTLVAVVDSCHSASALRGLKTGTPARARQFPGLQKYRSSGGKRDLDVFQYVQVDRLFLAACGMTEKAWELPIAGRVRGVFTYGVIQALGRFKGNIDAKSIISASNQVVRDMDLPQHPEFKSGSLLAGRRLRDLFAGAPQDQLAGMADPVPPFSVRVWVTEKGRRVFRIGERISVSAQSERDGFLYLLGINATGEVTLLFPNYWDRDNFVRARKIVRVPGPNFQSELFAAPPSGRDTILAIVSARRWRELEVGRPDAATVMAALDKRQIRSVVAGILTRNAVRSIRVRPKAAQQPADASDIWALGKTQVTILE